MNDAGICVWERPTGANPGGICGNGRLLGVNPGWKDGNGAADGRKDAGIHVDGAGFRADAGIATPYPHSKGVAGAVVEESHGRYAIWLGSRGLEESIPNCLLMAWQCRYAVVKERTMGFAGNGWAIGPRGVGSWRFDPSAAMLHPPCESIGIWPKF